MKQFIEGTRIYLRAVRENDLKELSRASNDEDITHYMMMGLVPDGGCLYCSRKNIYEEYEKLKKSDDIIFCICLKNSLNYDEIIGIIGLYEFNWIARNAELRIAITNIKYLSKGYGAEAVSLILRYSFHKLNLHKVRLGCNTDDIRANKCYQKCGFVFEGISRDYHFRNGMYYNCNMYSILDTEWRKFLYGKKDKTVSTTSNDKKGRKKGCNGNIKK